MSEATTVPSLPSLLSELALQNGHDLHPDEGCVMVTHVKPALYSNLGLGVTRLQNSWRLVITTISRNGLMANTDLRVGQTVLSINGTPANEFASAKDAAKAIRNSREVSIVATKSIIVSIRENHGQEQNELSQETEFDSNGNIGVVLGETQDGTIVITGISATSLVGMTNLFQVGMKLLAINNHFVDKTTTLLQAQTLIQTCKGHTTMMAVDDETTKMAVASKSTKALALFLEESSVITTITRNHTNGGKGKKQLQLGVRFQQRPGDWRILISDIESQELLQNTDLRVGQTLLAINDIPANMFSSVVDVRQKLSDLLHETSEISVVTTRSVLATVYKDEASTKVGIGFCHYKRVHTLAVDRIPDDGLFGVNGILQVGMKVVAINDKPCPETLAEANAIVKETIGPLTIIAVMEIEAT